MKTQLLFFFTILISALLTSPGGCLGQMKLMPLGDSITQGAVGAATYRCYLWGMLSKSGPQFDFVGSMNLQVNEKSPGQDTGCPHKGFDYNHEGHAGWTTDQILKQIGGWSTTYTPDVVLIHLGTNDLGGGQNPESVVSEMDLVVDYLRTANSKVVVFIAGVIPDTFHANFEQKTKDYNSRLSAFCSEKSTQESPVKFVDLHTGMDPKKDLFDGLHPSDSGNKKMANGWYKAIKAHFKK